MASIQSESPAKIEMLIKEKADQLASAKHSRDHYNEYYGYLMAECEQEIYELNIKLQLAEAAEEDGELGDGEEDEGWNVGLAVRQAASWDEEDPCYECGRAYYTCVCSSQLKADAQTFVPYADGGNQLCESCDGYVESCDCGARSAAGAALVGAARAPCYNCDGCVGSCGCGAEDLSAPQEEQEPPARVGTKLKWVSSTNPETYSVAIVKKDGILEVKRVTDGGGHCHNTTVCQCIPCSEIRLSNRLGVQNPPWRPRAPLLKTFFSTELEWRASLPGGGLRGSVKTTVPAISERTLKKLCCKPLSGTTDGLKLKELQERFPGGTMVLTTTKEQLEIEHVYYDIAAYPEDWCHQVYSKKQERAVMEFSDLGASSRSNGKPQLMVEWQGLYIDLSHLF